MLSAVQADADPGLVVVTFSSFTNMAGVAATSPPGAPCFQLLAPSTLSVIGPPSMCYWLSASQLAVLVAAPSVVLTSTTRFTVLGGLLTRADGSTTRYVRDHIASC